MIWTDVEITETEEWLVERFTEAVEREQTLIECDSKTNREEIHTMRSDRRTATKLCPTTTISVHDPEGLSAEITVEHEPMVHPHHHDDDDDDDYEYEPPEIEVGSCAHSDDPPHCEGCERPYDRDEWPRDEDASWASPNGGVSIWTCPTDGCPGQARCGW